MTEHQWLTCSDLNEMLSYLRHNKVNRVKPGRRKLRLFGCASCRRVWRLMAERGRQWLLIGERHADGALAMEERRQVESQELGGVDYQRADELADQAAWFTLGPNVMIVAEAASSSAASAIEIEAWKGGLDCAKARAIEHIEQVRLVYDVFRNPFQPVPTIDPAWLAWNDATVVKLAQAIYDDRAFDRLPILADALEEAGCNNEEILSHCRGPGPHVRGCWALDMLLGKS